MTYKCNETIITKIADAIKERNRSIEELDKMTNECISSHGRPDILMACRKKTDEALNEIFSLKQAVNDYVDEFKEIQDQLSQMQSHLMESSFVLRRWQRYSVGR